MSRKEMDDRPTADATFLGKGMEGETAMKIGRLVGPIALVVVVVLFYVSFFGFKDPERDLGSAPTKSANKPSKTLDIVYLWTDPGSKEFVDDFNELLMKEKDKPGKNFAVEFLQPRGMSFLRYFLRGVFNHCTWLNRIWIVRPNSKIPVPTFLNVTHPQSTHVISHSAPCNCRFLR
jgi:hypothetical protein